MVRATDGNSWHGKEWGIGDRIVHKSWVLDYLIVRSQQALRLNDDTSTVGFKTAGLLGHSIA
jgi:hypothetical protein